MRSVVVVLPASLCALIPMFLVRSSGYCLDITLSLTLPLEMSKGLVGLGHFMSVFFLLDRVSLTIRGGNKLCSEFLRHRLVLAVTGICDQPTHGKRNAAARSHFRGHLIGCPTNSSSL